MSDPVKPVLEAPAQAFADANSTPPFLYQLAPEKGREIAVQVQQVAETTDGATRAMRGASVAAQGTQVTSKTVLGSADEIASISSTLHNEVEQFLATMRTTQDHATLVA